MDDTAVYMAGNISTEEHSSAEHTVSFLGVRAAGSPSSPSTVYLAIVLAVDD